MEVQGIGTRQASQAATDRMKDELGKDAFLQLLVTQLKNQDPLNPMDNTEFITQLAQFSSLEGITNLEKAMTGVEKNISSLRDYGAANLIGRTVKTEGNKVEYSGGPVKAGFELADSAASVEVVIKDSRGVTLRTMGLGQGRAGYHDFVWDGFNGAGSQVPAGNYMIAVNALDGGGKPVKATTYVDAPVRGISYDSGSAMLVTPAGPVGMDRVRAIY